MLRRVTCLGLASAALPSCFSIDFSVLEEIGPAIASVLELSVWPEADVDGDGVIDLVVLHTGAADSSARLTWVSGAGHQPLHTLELRRVRSWILLVPDRDGDSGLDLCFLVEGDGSGDGRRAQVHSGRTGALLEVVDGDAASDLANSGRTFMVGGSSSPLCAPTHEWIGVSATGDGIVSSVELGKPAPCWTTLEPRLREAVLADMEPLPPDAVTEVAGDLDGDGSTDVLVRWPTDTLRLISGRTDTAQSRIQLGAGAKAWLRRESWPVADLDADGAPEILVVSALVLSAGELEPEVRAAAATWYSSKDASVLRTLTPGQLRAPPYSTCPRIELLEPEQR